MTRAGSRLHAGWLPALVVVVLAAGTSACAGQVDGTPGADDAPSTAAPTDAPPDQPDADRTALELAVLDALADDPHPKDARYEPDEDRVVVTVRTQGAPLDAAGVRALEETAERVTDGVDVVVETTDEDAPTED